MENSITIIKRNCKGCGKEYDAHRVQLLGMRNALVLGMQYCEICAKKKEEEEESRQRKLRELMIKDKREGWRENSGIPLRFMNQRFESLNAKRTPSLVKAYRDCLDFADKFPLKDCHGYRSLILYSDNVWGVGKSHLIASIGHRILDRWQGETRKCPIKYITEPDLFIRIRNTFNRTNYDMTIKESELDVYNELISVPLLIIDDMGKEEVADPRFVQRVLFEIINGRYDNMLPVIITANLNPDALEWHLGGDRGNSATFERIIEMTNNEFREIVATTYRDLRNRK